MGGFPAKGAARVWKPVQGGLALTCDEC